MSSTLLSLAYVKQTEKRAIEQFQNTLAGAAEEFPKHLDTLFKLSYFHGKLDHCETPSGGMQAVAFESYVVVPYTFLSTYSLIEKAYYLEAIILFRNLIEIFIQTKYFLKYPDKLEKHGTNKKRVDFKSMFDEFSPGYYEKHYGRQLSTFAHGRVSKSICRIKDGEIILGCKFNSNDSTYVLNQMIPLLLGYFQLFPEVFQKNTIKNNRDFQQALTSAIKWLKKAIKNHGETFPKSKEWLEHMERIIGAV